MQQLSRNQGIAHRVCYRFGERMKLSVKRTETRTFTVTDKSLVGGCDALVPHRDATREIREEVSRSIDIHCEAKFLSKGVLDRLLNAVGNVIKRWFPGLLG